MANGARGRSQLPLAPLASSPGAEIALQDHTWWPGRRRWVVTPTREETTLVTIFEHLAQVLTQSRCIIKYMLDRWMDQGREMRY